MKVVSLFCGAGGMDLGFQNAGCEIVGAYDCEGDCIKTHHANFDPIAQRRDVSVLGKRDIPDCDIVIGGPPCQGFSVAGKMDPNDLRSSLVWEFARIVDEVQPRFFVMENVKALATLQKWIHIRSKLQQEFYKSGYDVVCHILNSKDYGVPQSRERAFFIGVKKGETPIEEIEYGNGMVIAKSTLLRLPPPGTEPNVPICKAKIVPTKNPVLRKSPYAGMLFNGRGRPINLSGYAGTLSASMGGAGTPIVDELELRENAPSWIEAYHQDLMQGGKPVEEVPSRMRRITAVEATILQGFPIDWKFPCSTSSRYKQIGNSVPPPLARGIADGILATVSR